MFSYFTQKTGFDISFNLYELSKPIFHEKKNIINLSSSDITQSSKGSIASETEQIPYCQKT